MTTSFEWTPYALAARGPLNAASTRCTFKGALVRSDGGYGCVHPWPELGDRSLEEELGALATGEDTRLTAATRRCVALDSQARSDGRHLLEGLPVPKSHATLTEISRHAISKISELGYERVKLKARPECLKEIAALLDVSPLPTRLDFNEAMTPELLLDWHASMSDKAKSAIEFIEDPFPYEPDLWETLQSATGWAFAVDAMQESASRGFHFRVLKPAIENTSGFTTEDGRFLVTSYMDHPLGQLFAAYEAGRLAKRFPNQITTCGLATHHLFNQLDPALDLGEGPELKLPEGTGLGLDAYLEELPWRPLST
ncbi:MAG: hypothetical protein L7V86_17360 [Verrucomicrobiales bacterium]|nr:hypothetical protein [Verrucomicrobiales bacterium]